MDSPAADPINQRIAARVRQLRADAGLSLDALSAASGVSRSALSLIERAESSPTAVVLDRIAAALGVPLASLFDGPGSPAAASPLARRADQPLWRDPASGYLRRAVSPAGYPSPIQIVEVEFPPGASVAYEAALRDRTVHQQLWVLQGRIDFTVGALTYELARGDCLALQLDQPNRFHNPTRQTSRYAVVLVAEPAAALARR